LIIMIILEERVHPALTLVAPALPHSFVPH
jgi:hypothetical protein